MEKKCCGIDSRIFTRSNPYKPTAQFSAAFACGVVVNNYDTFKQKYVEVLSTLCKKYNIKQERNILCTHLIKEALGGNSQEVFEFFEEFYEGIIPHIDELHVFYSYFNSNQTVNIFWESGLRKIPIMDFLTKHVVNPFPYLCAYELMLNRKELFQNSSIFIDSCSGKLTHAWRELDNKENLKVVIKGDCSNYCISTADMFIEAIDNKMGYGRHTLDEKGIKTVTNGLGIKLDIHYVGQFKTMAPVADKNIDTSSRLARPIVFVVDEQNPLLPKTRLKALQCLLNYSILLLKIEGL